MSLGDGESFAVPKKSAPGTMQMTIGIARESTGNCPCGRPGRYGFPCVHYGPIEKLAHQSDAMPQWNASHYVHKELTLARAHAQYAKVGLPFHVDINNQTRTHHILPPPSAPRRRGRPSKRRKRGITDRVSRRRAGAVAEVCTFCGMSGHNRQACVAAGELNEAQYVEAVCTQGADLARKQLLYACSAVCLKPCHPHEQAECTVESESDSDDSDRDSDSDIDGTRFVRVIFLMRVKDRAEFPD
jgi:hypothetical protein